LRTSCDSAFPAAAGAELLRELAVDRVGCPLAICSFEGMLVAASPSARALLAHAGIDCTDPPCELPSSLWEALSHTPFGQSTDWRPTVQDERCLGFTRYRYGDEYLLLLMREITAAQNELRRRLQQQRLEAIGRLVAGIAHDLRAPLSSIVFGASVLSQRHAEMSGDQIRERLEQIVAAANRQQATIAGLLDFARLGPPIDVELSLHETFTRVAAFLRPTLRDRDGRLVINVHESAQHVRGNPLVIEQILVNLILNALEAAEGRVTVELRSAAGIAGNSVDVHVTDDGPGIPAQLAGRIFEPFFTTKQNGTGLGLVTAREAAEAQGGQLALAPSERGAHFILSLRAAQQSAADRGGGGCR
jgi:signal transduction histidine kinase